MAFVHHQPRQQRRDRHDRADDATSASYAPHPRHEREVTQDWSIVFPGRAREPPLTQSASTPKPLAALASASAPASPLSDHSDGSDPLALTLPPLHDGTGRFLASPLSPASTDVASVDAPLPYTADDDHLSDARHSEDVFPDSVLSGTDSQLDADEELGFGSGSDFDFESDAVASSHPGRSPVRRSAPRAASRRRPSKLSHASHVSHGSDDDDDDDEAGAAHSHNHLLGSKAWALLGRSNANALERVLESPSASTQLYSSAHSSRRTGRTRHTKHALPVVLTSGSEREDAEPLQRAAAEADRVLSRDEAELAASNLAQSAGLSHLDHTDLWRRPKRRHRRSAAGRSSKRSNTSQSLLSIDYDACRLAGAHRQADGAETPRSSTCAARLAAEHPSKTSRVIGSILRKVFDLEPEVLDAFLHEDAERHRSGVRAGAARPGFGFEASEAPLVSAPLAAAWTAESGEAGMMLDGRGEHERWPGAAAASEAELEVEVRELATSPLLANHRRVRGEELDDGAAAGGLTEAALLQRGSAAMRGARSASLMEPTTMEALSAFVNTMVMPVPMPFRLLGALFGWSGIWAGSTAAGAPGSASAAKQSDDEARAAGEAEHERKYRYERLLSAQQAKAWSRRYRGILFANVDDEQPSPDVPELWRGEEHPAIAAHHDVY